MKQVEEIGCQPRHAARFSVDGIDRLLANPGVLGAPSAQDACVAADARDGRRELVAGIGHKTGLRIGAALKPLDEPVQRAGKFSDLVTPRHREAVVETSRVDRVGGLTKVVHQAEHPSHRGLHEHDHDEHRGQGQKSHRPPDGVDHPFFRRGHVGDVEHSPSATGQSDRHVLDRHTEVRLPHEPGDEIATVDDRAGRVTGGLGARSRGLLSHRKSRGI
jgi:hypothetical protein